MKDNENLRLIGALVTIAAFIYLLIVLASHAVPFNPATWIMWTILDIFLAYTMKKAGKSPWIMIAFAIGAGLIGMTALIQLSQGKTSWTWGPKETLTAICFVGTFIARRYAVSNNLSMNIGATAMFIAGAPTLIDTWNHPMQANPLFWGVCTLGWVFTLMGTKRSFSSWYLPVGGFALNGSIAALAMGWIK